MPCLSLQGLCAWEQPGESEAQPLSFLAFWSGRLGTTEANSDPGGLVAFASTVLQGRHALGSELPCR